MNKTYELVKKLYKIGGIEQLELSDSQCDLFDLIFKKKNHRNHIMTYTQFGKSLISGIACLTRVATFPEKWAIIGPTKDKAKIIMSYIIEHIFDNPYIVNKLMIKKDESLERIRRERSKNRLTFKIGDNQFGEVFILSAEATRQVNVEKALMGYGAPNVIEDESALIPDKIHSTVMRMLGGTKDNYLFKVGNPFKRNHFLRSYRNNNYKKFVLNYKDGIKEGRLTEEFIEEMRNESMFDILYECKFPDADTIDDKGYLPLIYEKYLNNAYSNFIGLGSEIKLGVDVGGSGRNMSVIVARGSIGGEIFFRERTPDTMSLVNKIEEAMNNYSVEPKNIFIDAIGIGKGVYDRLSENYPEINGVMVGAKPENDDEDFLNQKAQYYWRVAEWLKSNGKLKGNFDELLNIRYKIQSDKKIKIKSKEEMLKDGIQSPDVADALMLTFCQPQNEVDITII